MSKIEIFLAGIRLELRSFNQGKPRQLSFIADHPFIFYITAWGESGLNVLFSGNLVRAN